MDGYFNYADLTWPEVESLPRDTPLVVPVGAGFDLEQLTQQLGVPSRIGLLPAFPFGWPGSGLEVPRILLGRYVGNLLGSLQKQGFTRAYALTILDRIPLLADTFLLHQPRSGQRVASHLFPTDADRSKVILIPIGHTEQHGLHLPLSVDTIIIEAIARGAVATLPDQAFSLPVMPYGVSTHREAFAGTLDAGGRTFEDFWLAVIDSLMESGCERIYLISGHGGNVSFLVNVAKYAGERHRRVFIATAFLHTAGPLGAASLQKHRTSAIGGMGHAGELETSLMLHLQPALCHMERLVDETDFIATPSYYMDWIEGGSLIANPPWDDDTKTGAYGAGSHGTAEKGKLWLAAAIEEKVDHVREINEQHRRRESRRASGYGRWGLDRG
jgi:creatinine amidohydrolase